MDDMFSVPLDSTILFSSDESLAAGLCRSPYPDCCNGVALIAVAPGVQPAFQVADVEGVSTFCWVPGGHTLLLLSAETSQLALLVAGVSPPAVLRSGSILDTQRHSPSLAAAPCGTSAFVLATSTTPHGVQGILALHDAQSLQHLSADVWQLPRAPGSQVTVHCSQQTVVACIGGIGTRVWSFSGRQLGPVLFWADGLDCAAVSCDGFIAGVRASLHDVLDGKTGASLSKLPMLVPDLDAPPAKPVSIIWAGPHSSRLHACYTCGKPDGYNGEDSVLLYRLLSY